jgi:hypothetical protein
MASGSTALLRRAAQPRTSRLRVSCQASAEHFQQCAELALFRNRGLGPVAMTVLPVPLARRAAATACAARAIGSVSLADTPRVCQSDSASNSLSKTVCSIVRRRSAVQMPHGTKISLAADAEAPGVGPPEMT